MNSLLLQYILPCTFTGGMFALFCFVLRPLIKKLKALYERRILVITAVIFILPMFLFPSLFKIIIPRQDDLSEPAVTAEVLSTAMPTAGAYNMGQMLADVLETQPEIQPEIEPQTDELAVPIRQMSLMQVITLTWIAGVCAAAIMAIVPYVQLCLKVRRSSVAEQKNSNISSLYDELCGDMYIKRKPQLWRSACVGVPLLMGIFKPRIVLPTSIDDEKQILHALRHELAHYRQKDILLKHIILLIRIIHWFNPLVYVLSKQFNTVCEKASDEYATAAYSFSQRKDYAKTLLSLVCEKNLPMVSAFGGHKKQLSERMKNIMKPYKTSKPVMAMCVTLIAVTLAIAVLTGCGFSAGTTSSAAGSEDFSIDGVADIAPQSSEAAGDSTQEDDSMQEDDSGRFTVNYVDITSAQVPLYNSTGDEDAIEYVDEYILPVDVNDISEIRAMDGTHKGVDFYGDEGTPIYAGNYGVVVDASWHYSYGWNIVIEHSDGISTRYAQLDSMAVVEGDDVSQGQYIGGMGNTGYSTGTHLHMEMLDEDGEVLNPEDYIDIPPVPEQDVGAE